MDVSWWKQAKGDKTNNYREFQEYLRQAGDRKLVIVDFFMPECYYCIKFKDGWNQIVDEFSAEYGPEQIAFVKVDGTQDGYTASLFQIESFPGFVAIEPGSMGDDWVQWHPQKRDYPHMKKWLKQQLEAQDLHPLQSGQDGPASALAAQKLQNDYLLGAPLPLSKDQPSAELFQLQMDENKKMAELIQSMLASQQQTAKATETLQESVLSILETQEAQQSVQMQEVPTSGPSASFTAFLAGTLLGVILGLFFASYLVKMGRLGGRKGKQQQSSQPPAKEFAEIVKHGGRKGENASLRTGSTQSGSPGGSDHNNSSSNELETFL